MLQTTLIVRHEITEDSPLAHATGKTFYDEDIAIWVKMGTFYVSFSFGLFLLSISLFYFLLLFFVNFSSFKIVVFLSLSSAFIFLALLALCWSICVSLSLTVTHLPRFFPIACEDGTFHRRFTVMHCYSANTVVFGGRFVDAVVSLPAPSANHSFCGPRSCQSCPSVLEWCGCAGRPSSAFESMLTGRDERLHAVDMARFHNVSVEDETPISVAL